MINIPLKVTGNQLIQEETVNIASGCSNSVQVTLAIDTASDFADFALKKRAVFRYYQGSYFISDVDENNQVIVPKFVIAYPYFKVALRAQNEDKTLTITTNEIQIPVDKSPVLYESTIVDGDVNIRNNDGTLAINKSGDVVYINFATAYKTAVDAVIAGTYATASALNLVASDVDSIKEDIINMSTSISDLQGDITDLDTTKADKDNVYTKVETEERLAEKQDTLVSGENIKTINGTSLLGSGDYAFDTAFDETSTNAVQNKVISKEVKELNYELAVLREAVFEVVLSEIDYTSVFTDSFVIPDTLTDTDGTHRVVFSETELKKVSGNSVVANQLDRHLTFNNNGSQYYSCSVDTTTGLYTLEIIKEGLTSGEGFVSYTNTVFSNNVSANDKLLIYFDVIENTLKGADTGLGQLWVFSNDGYSISYQNLAEGQHANIISVSTNQGSANITSLFRPLGSGTIPEQEVGTKLRFYLRAYNLTKRYGTNTVVNAIIGTGTSDEQVARLLERDPKILDDTDYDAGTIKSSIINGLQSLDSNDEVIGTISIPSTEIKSAGTAQDYIEVVDGDIVEGEQLYNLVKTTNIGSVDLGTLNWTLGGMFYALLPSLKITSLYTIRAICTKYPWGIPQSGTISSIPDKTFTLGNEYAFVYIKDSTYATAQDFKTAMNGVPLYYQLATPTQTTIATNLHFSEISMLIQEGGKIKPLYDNVPVDTTLTFVVKKAISE